MDLLDLLRPNCSDYDAIIFEAMDHPHAGVRMDGYSCSDKLPASMARSRLRTGLSDPSAGIRAYCAGALVELPTSDAEKTEDLTLLRTQLAKEKDQQAIEALKSAVKQLE
jgi:hypothetical protein